MIPPNLIPIRYVLAGALVLAALVGVKVWKNRIDAAAFERGKNQVQQRWDAQTARQLAEAVEQGRLNALESLRRITRQQENQRAQDAQLAAARADAGRNAADAERLRDQSAEAARQWRAALDHPAAGGQCQAAGDAIGVLADVLGRADRRAGVLAAYADAARIAGLKCEADYDALTPAR